MAIRIRRRSQTSCSRSRSVSFLVCGDPQYLAEHADKPMKLDPLSEQANSGFVKRVLALPGSKLPEAMGGGTVATDLRGLINTGDLIDSLDKNGGSYVTRNNWETAQWDRLWEKPIDSPERESVDASTTQ